MAGKGGYEPPEKPAAVSGPGKFSARTDGKPGTQPVRDLPDAGYGEQATFRDMQSGAAMADSQGVPAAGPAAAPAGRPAVPLTEPTGNPDEPITTGIPAGPGPGPEILGNPAAVPPAEVARLQQWLPLLKPRANSAEASDSFRGLVRYIENLAAEQELNGGV